jgi:xanthine dehydrogenase accessory factor
VTFKEVNAPLKRWSDAGARAGVATLIAVRRSAPRAPGARFAASDGGEVAGSVSSGCVEADLYEHIQGVLEAGEPRLVEYRISDEMAGEVGLSCGGEIDVLVAPYAPGEVWAGLEEAVAAKEAVVLVTGLSEGIRGRQLLLRFDGTRTGTLGDASLDDAAAEATRSLFDTGGAPVIELDDPEARIFAEAYLPPDRLAIVGATPVGAALCHLASYLGIAVTVIDPRAPFAPDERFPEAERVLRVWPEEGLEMIGLDRYWNVVVLAHDDKLDGPALAAALRVGCLYVGQIGGRRTQRMRREALVAQGFSEDEVGRIHGPVGLDIGAESPEEIALSILAELVAVRRRGAGGAR